MTQSQPQRKQRPADTSLWSNNYKTEPKQPDYRGNIKVSWELVQELYVAFQSGNYQTDDYSGQPFIQLDMTVWGHPEAVGTTKPVLTGGASSLADTMAQAARRAESKAAKQGGSALPMPQAQAPDPAQQAALLAQQQAEQQAAFLAHQQQQQQAALLAAQQAQAAQAVAAPVPAPVAPAPLPAPPAAAPTPIAGTIHGGGALPSPALPPNF